MSDYEITSYVSRQYNYDQSKALGTISLYDGDQERGIISFYPDGADIPKASEDGEGRIHLNASMSQFNSFIDILRNKKPIRLVYKDGNGFLETPKPQENGGNGNGNGGGEHPSFYTKNGKIYDANDNEFIARGVNNRHVWFDLRPEHDPEHQAALKALDNISSFEFNSVRIVWEVTHPDQTPTNDSILERIIQTSIDNKMVPMVELHDFTGSENTNELLNIGVKWWTDRAAMWKKYERYLMINIANEFGNWDIAQGSRRQEFPRVYKEAIRRIRGVGITNLLIIDPFIWAKDYTLVRDYGQEIYDSDTLKNVAFSIHFYCGEGEDRNKIKDAFESIKGRGLPMMVGEFSHQHPPCGNIEYEYIMEQAEEYGVGYYAWAWDDPPFAVVDPSLGNRRWEASTESELSPWGRRLIYGANGIRMTSKRASIFDDSLNRESGEIRTLETPV